MTSSNVCLDARDLLLGHKTRRGNAFSTAVLDLNLQIMDEEFVVIVGPSGCGKTTFLEAVAGLVPVAGGALEVGGKPVKGPGPERSLVFQHASLYPWRTVMDNVLFGPQVQGRLTAQVRKRAEELLEIVGLSHVTHKYPHELSGGMKQRVNLARALATDPTLLLLDEPFGALDAQTREILQDELLRIWQADTVSSKKTAMFVTHDVNEAVLLADRVLVFSKSPAHVALEVKIDAPRPRDAAWRRSSEFLAYGDRILEALHHKPADETTSTATETAASEDSARNHDHGVNSDQAADHVRATGGDGVQGTVRLGSAPA
ncbi:ABC transporter ATP-binding protein [Amycolatopsis sp. FDAARGOS 1241]|uniref:ABC transporter ATP-binding protein n=1 Tax=Amycolatopsis sp. FDAARGOS 1241 TaxID=2778070 RepID=UPI0019517245|nr:ABC transporter ATP-binding protein [Amycolatopsis sp. FDAARGOS 1241]QRP49332.1 ABC transporter ATP-binding protein [Amycolatopsis sp. FDAARGOS 1241]